MKKIFHSMMVIALVMEICSSYFPVHAAGSEVTLLGRDGETLQKITDGNGVQIQVKLPQTAEQNERIIFHLNGANIEIGECTISQGADLCRTEIFNTLGWYWNSDGTPSPSRSISAFSGSGELMGTSNPFEVMPRPVVMVHGFISDWTTWKPYLGADGFLSTLGLSGYAVGDGQVEGAMNTGSLTDPAGRTNTIAQNAEIEGEYIEGVRRATGAEMVDLVVHSMGGMISRYYIDRVMQERDVAQLIMLGSPMGGSDCSVLPAALGFYLPASLEIRQSYMRGIFNNQITRRRGIEFYDLGGTPILEPFKSPCTDVPNDTVVSFGSVNAIELRSEQVDIIHSNMTYSPEVFDQFVTPLLKKGPGQFQTAQDVPPANTTSESLQFTRVYKSRVDAGGSTELTINIEPNISVASFALFDPSRSVTVSVVGASGNEIRLDSERNGFIQVDDPSSMIYLGYGFANPKPGVWKVTIHASPSTPSEGTEFAVSVYFVGGATLKARSSTLIPKQGETVQLTAEVVLNNIPQEIREAKAVIRDPNGNTEILEFAPGTSISKSWTPKTSGLHGIDIVVTSGGSNESAERTAFLSVEVQPNLTALQVTGNLILLVTALLVGIGAIIFALIRTYRRIAQLKS